MDIQGFKLSEYRRVHPKLRPQIDHDLVGNLMCVIQEGGGASAKKARHRLFLELENARLERDRGLSGEIRRMIRRWESLFVDDEAQTLPPPCFALAKELTTDPGETLWVTPDDGSFDFEPDVTASRVPQ